MYRSIEIENPGMKIRWNSESYQSKQELILLSFHGILYLICMFKGRIFVVVLTVWIDHWIQQVLGLVKKLNYA